MGPPHIRGPLKYPIAIICGKPASVVKDCGQPPLFSGVGAAVRPSAGVGEGGGAGGIKLLNLHQNISGLKGGVREGGV